MWSSLLLVNIKVLEEGQHYRSPIQVQMLDVQMKCRYIILGSCSDFSLWIPLRVLNAVLHKISGWQEPATNP